MTTYKNIAKTTGVIAFVKIFTIIFGIIRAKAIAILIGPAGFGLYSIYNGYFEFISTLATLGIDQSGVREIAKNNDKNNLISKTRITILISIIITSLLLSLLCSIYSKLLSKIIFGTDKYNIGILIINFGVIFNCLARGKIAILNGLRNINQLAYCQIIGAIIGSISSIILIYFTGEKGIPISIFIVAVSLLLSTHYYEKRITINNKVGYNSFSFIDAKNLLTLGLSLSLSGVISVIFSNLSMIYIRNTLGVDTVGLYTSSWTISNVYIGTILGAMGVDFLPRLMSSIDDNQSVGKMINEQIEMGVLLGGIGILFTILFAPTIINILYTKNFIDAVDIVRWHSCGIILRVITWPLAFLLTAKGKGLLYITIQTIFSLLEYLLLIFFIEFIGRSGLGINYFCAYVCYFIMIYATSLKLINFKFSKNAIILIIVTILLFTCGAVILFFIKNSHNTLLSIILLFINSLWIFYFLKSKMEIDIFSIINNKLLK